MLVGFSGAFFDISTFVGVFLVLGGSLLSLVTSECFSKLMLCLDRSDFLGEALAQMNAFTPDLRQKLTGPFRFWLFQVRVRSGPSRMVVD